MLSVKTTQLPYGCICLIPRVLQNNHNVTFLKAELCVISRGDLLPVNTVQLALIVVLRFPRVFFKSNQKVATLNWQKQKGMFAFVIEMN